MAAPGCARADQVAPQEQAELAQLQASHLALQNRLLQERSTLGSTSGALQVRPTPAHLLDCQPLLVNPWI